MATVIGNGKVMTLPEIVKGVRSGELSEAQAKIEAGKTFRGRAEDVVPKNNFFKDNWVWLLIGVMVLFFIFKKVR
jgi:hypothetical protein